MRSLLVFILYLFAQSVFSQDLIATVSGDSLNCKIIKNEADHIHYKHIKNHRLSSDSISTDSVASFIIGYYKQVRNTIKKPVEKVATPEPVEQTVKKPESTPKVITPKPSIVPRQHKNKSELPPLYLSVRAGFSNRTGEIDESLDEFLVDFLKKLRRGNGWGFDVGYFFNDNVGVGITYSHYFSNEVLENVLIEDSLGQLESGDYSVDINIRYTAASLLLRTALDDRNIIMGKASMGYTSFRDEEKIVSIDYLATGQDFGMSLGGSYMYMIDQNFSIGATIEYNYSIISNLDITIDNQNFTLFGFPEDASRYNLEFLVAAWF